jgi:ABC-type Fe3+ transport system substrate-binding protein
MRKQAVLLVAALGMIGGILSGRLPAAETGSQRMIEAAIKTGELDGARKGEVRYWSNSPTGKELAEIEKAFNKRFGLNVEVRGLPISAVDVVNRLFVSAQAGQPADGDVMLLSPASLYLLHQKRLLEDFGWTEIFGKEFPDVKKRVDRLAPEFRNKGLELYHLVYVIAYRTDRVKKDELPRAWGDLSDPRWSGRVAIPNSGAPFSYLAAFPTWGEKKAVELAKSIKSNRAITVKGSPAVAAILESGEASLGITTVGNVEFSKAKGVPVDWTVVPGIVVNPKNLAVTKGAPHVNLARLFVAWLSTEGRPVYEKVTWDGLAWPDEDSFLAKHIKQLGVGGDLLVMDTYEKDEIAQKTWQKLSKIYMGQ